MVMCRPCIEVVLSYGCYRCLAYHITITEGENLYNIRPKNHLNVAFNWVHFVKMKKLSLENEFLEDEFGSKKPPFL
jgi:hypothetical protein